MNHSPADIVRKALVNLGVGVMGGSSGNWPIGCTSEQDKPDSTITVYNTPSITHGRILGGEVLTHFGIQIRVRASTAPEAYAKASAICGILDTVIYRTRVTIDSSNYRIENITRMGDPTDLGKESPTSKRNIVTVNAITSIRPL